jgi:hypothetical protein
VKPKCACFEAGVGDAMIGRVAQVMYATFGEVMNTMGVCPDAHEMALETTIVMLMRAICVQTTRMDDAAEDMMFRKMLDGLEGRLSVRNAEMEHEALEFDKAEAGGVN